MVTHRVPVSIVCVSNDAGVLGDCLIRSIEVHRATAPDTELIVVENADQQFATAGAALNHGASLSKNEVCVFVHQDVYLHSLERLEEAASTLLHNRGIGLIGAIGITAGGGLIGRIRDRMVLLGERVAEVAEVDSVDEVLFMVRRQQLLEEGLSEDRNLAWHAYAIEYGARMKREGKLVAVCRIPLTHNSLRINVDRLTEAHAQVARLYPEQIPLMTTMGPIAADPKWARGPFEKHRWRYRWLRASWKAHAARRAIGRFPVVISDIGADIDCVLEACGLDRVTVIAVKADESDADLAESMDLARLGRTFTFQLASPEVALERIRQQGEADSILLTNLEGASLKGIRGLYPRVDALLGYDGPPGFWLVTGPAANASPEAWRCHSAVPLGLRSTS